MADTLTNRGGHVRTDLDSSRAIADAVLYEGYVLYPYRRSSGKNRVRWQFGVLAPRRWLAAQGPLDETSVAGSVEAWFAQTECLLDGAAVGTVTVRVRFLQVQAKTVERSTGDGGFEPVDALDAGGQRHLTFDEARAHERDIVVPLRGGEQRFDIHVPGERLVEDVPGGRVARRCWPISARVVVSADGVEAPFALTRLRVRVENAVDDLALDATRDDALRRALLATHLLLVTDTGGFVSLLDPPEWATPAALECRNIHTFPVLVGEPGHDAVVLSSPIILYDHVQVAPESPGDLHDGGEIDEILSLRTLTLTEEEKAEARATDPRTAAIVDRVDTMPPEIMDRLHGAIRSLRPTATAQQTETDDEDVPWWQPGGDADVSPETDSVLVSGVRIAAGSRVRLHPRARGTDVHDMFLAGRTARVSKVLLDVDGSRYVAVTLDDDPGADLLDWYGRYFHFRPEEIEPVVGSNTTDPAERVAR